MLTMNTESCLWFKLYSSGCFVVVVHFVLTWVKPSSKVHWLIKKCML